MGLFGGKGISKKPVKQWNSERVARWLTSIGKGAYAQKFKGVTGQRLLKLKVEDIYELTDTRLEGDVIMDAIIELKKRDGVPPAELNVNAGVDENARPQNIQSVTQMPMFVKTSSRGVASSLSSDTQSPAIGGANLTRTATPTHTGTPVSHSVTPSASIHRGTADSAAALAHLVGDEDVVAGLFEFLSLLGIQGMGLVEATERAPTVGHVIGAIWELHDLVADAKGNRPNCVQLNAYCQDILRVFDAEGKRLAFLDDSALVDILQLVEKGIGIVDSNCRPGWLLRMATNDKSVEEFQAAHNSILEVLRREKVDTLPNGRQLTYGEYRDASRPLKRFLKQLGSGSLEAGLAFVLQHEDAQTSISQLIGIDKQLVVKDLEHRDCQPEQDVLSTMATTHFGDGPNDLFVGRDREYHTIFAQYDKNGSGALEFEELRSVLADLSLLDNIKPTEIEPYTRQQFEMADADGDGAVNFEEFTHFYQALTTSKARRELRSIMGPHAEKELKKIFSSFVSFGVRQHVDEMDGARFSKLCRDCKLLSKDFTTTDVDLVFAKIKAKGHRRITFDGFLGSLLEIADKKKQPLEVVVEQVLSAGGPTVTATKADYVKFHDDKSTYTGVYSRGGPTNVEPSKDLSALLDRSEADVRGVKKRLSSGGGSAAKSLGHARNSSAASSNFDSGSRSGQSSRRESALGESVGGSIDGGRSRKSSYGGEPTYAASTLGPLSSRSSSIPPVGLPLPTKPQVSGPPATASPRTSRGSIPRSSSRNAEVEVQYEVAAASPSTPVNGALSAPDSARNSQPGDTASGVAKDSEGSSPPTNKAELKAVFLAYVNFGSRAANDGPAEMEGAKFAKLCRECHLLSNTFNSTSADLVFSKVKSKGARKIDFRSFRKAIEEIAKAKSVDPITIEQQIIASGGPQMSSTTPSCHIRLHDDKASYTGVYKAGGPSVIDKHITLENLTDRTNVAAPSNRPRMAI